MSHRLPLLTAAALFLDLVLGGLVVGLNAGFACPDWPLCNGRLLPTLDVQVLVEYIHRLTTSILSLLILMTLAVAWWKRKTVHRWVPTLASLSLLFLVLQIVLGAIIVKFVLPGWFTTVDVINSMALFSTLTIWTVVCLPNKERQQDLLHRVSELKRPAFVAAVFTFFQVALGAFFRHSGAGEAYFGQNGYLASHHETAIPSKLLSTLLLGFHIFVAVGLTVSIIWLYTCAKRKQALVRSTLLLIALVLVQMIFGFATLATSLSLFTVTVHWAVSTLMLATSIYMITKVYQARNYLTDTKSLAGTDHQRTG